MRVYNGKVGTIPAAIQFRYFYKLRPGLRVWYRQVGWRNWYGRWDGGMVDKVNPDGFVFISKM